MHLQLFLDYLRYGKIKDLRRKTINRKSGWKKVSNRTNELQIISQLIEHENERIKSFKKIVSRIFSRYVHVAI